jgi:hypothetical protein
MPRPTRIRAVTPLNGFNVRLTLTDGTVREVDLEQYLNGPVFERIRSDVARFREIAVDSTAGTVVWPNGADIDPDVLCGRAAPAPAESQPAKATSKR